MKSTFGSRLVLASLIVAACVAAGFLVRVEARPQAQKMGEDSWTDYSEEADIDSMEPESNDMSAYLPGKNVSREEYVRAYTVYMANVRNRREESRGSSGHRSAAERRKKAQILVQTLYPSETRMADMADAGVTLVTLAFDMKPVELSDGIRVKEAKLYAPQGCVIGKSEESKWADGGFKVGHRVTKSSASKDKKMELSVACPEKILPSSSFKLEVILLDMTGDDRLKREVRHKDRKLRFSDFAESDDPAVRKQRYSRLGKRHSKECHEGKSGCCRKSWKVNLEDLKIHNDDGMVFMLPREVDLHYCDGKCSGKHVPYASNHAIFRKMFAKSMDKPMGEVGKLCCVPTKFEDLDVIQFDPVTSTLKNTVIHNAVVKECGCI